MKYLPILFILILCGCSKPAEQDKVDPFAEYPTISTQDWMIARISKLEAENKAMKADRDKMLTAITQVYAIVQLNERNCPGWHGELTVQK